MLKLTADQQEAISYLYEGDASLLVAATGAGKTVIGLTAMKELLDAGEHKRFIVGVPAKVLETQVWSKEVPKWAHLGGLRVRELDGTIKIRTTTLLQPAQINIISLNNLEWLLKQDHRATGIIIDEISKASGRWTRALRSKKYGDCFTWRCGMSATPVTQNLQKLFKIARVLDHGEALGGNEAKFLAKYFDSSFDGKQWVIRDDGSAEKILTAVEHLIHVVPDTKAATLPACHYHTIKFQMPKETRDIYEEMKTEMVVEVEEELIDYIDGGDQFIEDMTGEEELILDAANSAVSVGKQRQIASGFMYADAERKRILRLDQERLLAAAEWWAKLDGRRGLLFYEFVEQGKALESWIPPTVELAQINSMSHGVEGLQFQFADLLFYQQPWSRDAYEQCIGRVWRTGQEHEVNVTVLECEDSVDQIAISRVAGNAQWMEMLKAHMKGK